MAITRLQITYIKRYSHNTFAVEHAAHQTKAACEGKEAISVDNQVLRSYFNKIRLHFLRLDSRRLSLFLGETSMLIKNTLQFGDIDQEIKFKWS